MYFLSLLKKINYQKLNKVFIKLLNLLKFKIKDYFKMIRIYTKSGIIHGYSYAEYIKIKQAKWKIGKN